jgi:hypothetical protein
VEVDPSLRFGGEFFGVQQAEEGRMQTNAHPFKANAIPIRKLNPSTDEALRNHAYSNVFDSS